MIYCGKTLVFIIFSVFIFQFIITSTTFYFCTNFHCTWIAIYFWKQAKNFLLTQYIWVSQTHQLLHLGFTDPKSNFPLIFRNRGSLEKLHTHSYNQPLNLRGYWKGQGFLSCTNWKTQRWHKISGSLRPGCSVPGLRTIMIRTTKILFTIMQLDIIIRYQVIILFEFVETQFLLKWKM